MARALNELCLTECPLLHYLNSANSFIGQGMIELRPSSVFYQAPLPPTTLGAQLESSAQSLNTASSFFTVYTSIGLTLFLVISGLAIAICVRACRSCKQTYQQRKRYQSLNMSGDSIGDIVFSKRLVQVGPILPSAASQRFSRSVLTLASRCVRLLDTVNGNTIAISGTKPGNGVTTISTALARYFAKQGARTLLIDMNFSRPMVHPATRSVNGYGISNYLLSGTQGDMVNRDQRSMLDIIGPGTVPLPYLQRILQRGPIANRLAALLSNYERVIIDCACHTNADIDTSWVTALCDIRLLVINAQSETPESERVQTELAKQRQWPHGMAFILRNKVLSDTTSQHLDPYRPSVSNPRIRSIHAEAWILDQPNELYTLKLTELSYRPILTKRQVSIYAGYQIACFRFTILQRVNYLLILGQFASQEEAKQASVALGLDYPSVQVVKFYDIKQGIQLERKKQRQTATASTEHQLA